MRQWKNTTSNDYIIESSKREDIIERIKKLAAAYVPEWQFDEDNPDIGSVIALLFADEMMENIRRYNTLLERDYVELMNMLGISLKPAYPAHSIVLLQLASDTIPGFMLRKGSKLLGGPEEDANLVFETAHNVYITESKISAAFMVSGKNGKVIPLVGQFPPIEYVGSQGIAEELEGKEFSLFDFSGEGYGKYGVLFYHKHLFDVEDNDIMMAISSAPGLVQDIAEGRYRLSYYGEDGFEEVDAIKQVDERRLVFRKSGKCVKINEKGEDYSVLLLEPLEIPEKSVLVEDVSFSSSGEGSSPDMIFNGTIELDSQQFMPFGETLSLYEELYIGQDEYFCKPGARVTVDFFLDFDTHLVSVPVAQEEAELKVIKKKPKKDARGAAAEIFVGEVSIEYFNGTGWRKLKLDAPMQQMFSFDKPGRCELSFVCPADWRAVEIGGYAGRSIRIQIIRCDNCYYQPAIHHYPVMRDMKIRYTYENNYDKPARIISFQGSAKRDLTMMVEDDSMIPLFTMSSYQDTALYLGFDKKLENGPISVMVRAKECEGYQQGRLCFSYSTRDGFSRLKLSDHTDGLSHTGTILFMPPSDMAKRTLEGQEAYWIRISDEKQGDNPGKRPMLYDFSVNAVEVDNVDTMGEEDYYIDTFGPDMKFALNAQNILSLDLWVNEKDLFSESEIKRMLKEDPENTRAEYSFLGEIEEFYVKWQEVDNFDCSKAGDRHYVIDRMNSTILFGDGVHVQIPRNTTGIAFKIVMRRCDGEQANLGEGMVTGTRGSLMFVDRITNPVQAYGGMNMESVEEALCRGTGVLNSRNRLVSVQDYEREALNFSGQIVQAKAIVGRKKDGSFVPGAITLVLLMQDYMDGESSFLQMRQRLREHLLPKCELSTAGNELEIVEPLFVEICVEAWVQTIHADDTFEVQQELSRVLSEYLDPLTNTGWDIGRMVTMAQIKLRLNMEKGKALLHRLMVTARYEDEAGYHETDLEKLAGNPYVLVTSGTHKIHFEQSH